eukprot:1383994-Amorphochlora_amoeboformis.AAC.1
MDPQQEEFPILCETCLGENPFVPGKPSRLNTRYQPSPRLTFTPPTRPRFPTGKLVKSARSPSHAIAGGSVAVSVWAGVAFVSTTHRCDILSPGYLLTLYNSGLGHERGTRRLSFAGVVQSPRMYAKPACLICSMVSKIHTAQPSSTAAPKKVRIKNNAEIDNRVADMVTLLVGHPITSATHLIHEMPVTGDLANQNIRDRYYGKNDPVAKKILKMSSQRQTPLVPPDDKV